MARYFFDVSNGQYTPDLSGIEFGSLEQARLEAVKLAGELLCDNPAQFWHGEDWFVEVKDDHGLSLFTLAFMASEAPSIRGRNLPSLKPSHRTITG